MNAHLQEIKCNKRSIGGVNVIIIGDLYQLKPVQAGYIFQPLQSDYCCIMFYQLTSILVISLLNAIAKAWVIIEILQEYCIRQFLHFLQALHQTLDASRCFQFS